MTPQEQRDWLDAELFREGYCEPWEMRLRGIAHDVVREPFTFAGGTLIPFKLRDRRGITDVRVQLIPDLLDDLPRAQLLAERILREATT